MNKKSIFGIIVVIVIIAVAIGIFMNKGGTNASETTNNVYIGDSTTPISTKDIINAYKDNQAKFDEEYKGKNVRFIGTISQIQTNTIMNGSSEAVDIIMFKEGWQLQFPTGFCKTLSKLNKGDKLEVISQIQIVSGNTIEVFDYGYKYENGRKVYTNGSSIKLNGEEICVVNQ